MNKKLLKILESSLTLIGEFLIDFRTELLISDLQRLESIHNKVWNAIQKVGK